MKILIADDSRVMRQIVTRTLRGPFRWVRLMWWRMWS